MLHLFKIIYLANTLFIWRSLNMYFIRIANIIYGCPKVSVYLFIFPALPIYQPLDGRQVCVSLWYKYKQLLHRQPSAIAYGIGRGSRSTHKVAQRIFFTLKFNFYTYWTASLKISLFFINFIWIFLITEYTFRQPIPKYLPKNNSRRPSYSL